jgi:hypothetical protein
MADRAELEVVPFAAEHAEGVFDVILPIQQAEFGIPITRAEQTDLADIPGVYQRGAGQFWVALARGRASAGCGRSCSAPRPGSSPPIGSTRRTASGKSHPTRSRPPFRAWPWTPGSTRRP